MRRGERADRLLAELRDFLAQRERIDDQLSEQEAELLLALKEERVSWKAIASVYGVTHQALRQRFSRVEMRMRRRKRPEPERRR